MNAGHVAGTAVGRIKRVSLREVWPHEALDFTPWLERNPDALSEVLDLSIDNIERERSAGDFSVDLVAEDQAGDLVVIENQLEKSDHDHLGKLITYVAALEARTAIWIVSRPRPEHTGAITWLNESQAASFYLIQVEAIRIGDSPAAPLLTLITGPSEETRQVGVEKQERAERHDLREAFWVGLLDRARGRTGLHSAVAPNSDSWLAAGSGRSGVHFTYVIRRHRVGAYLFLEGSNQAQNHAVFDELAAESEAIEAEFGGPLVWDKVETRKRCQIGVEIDRAGYRDDPNGWPLVQEKMVDAMVRLEKVFKPRIPSLPKMHQ
jgi:hypothetical protein